MRKKIEVEGEKGDIYRHEMVVGERTTTPITG
jgi:hypothetical protein